MNYMLRGVEEGAWRKFTAQAKKDNFTAKSALLALIQAYVDRRIVLKSRVEATVVTAGSPT